MLFRSGAPASIASPLIACAMLVAASGCAPAAPSAADPPSEQLTARSPAGLELAPLRVESEAGVHRFTVEIARSAEEQARGLMFRTRLGDDEGMLFPFARERAANFWMKNTVIALDIIFIRADGTIESIAKRTTPYSLDPIRSGEPVAAVLEIRGGLADELGIAAGDRVSWGG